VVSGERGRFIVLEGIDGSGKTEQTACLAAWLRERGLRVVETREPTDGAWGRRYRAWARGELEATRDEVLGFFVEDRREHVRELIEPALAAGEFVVCDRYVHSTRAYQAADGIDPERLRVLLAEFPTPDLVLWLRLPVQVALARLGTRELERYEDEAFLRRVDAEYARFGLSEVDADAGIAAVSERVCARVGEILPGGEDGGPQGG